MKKLGRIFRVLVYILPAVLFFSYQPLMHFAANESMNFEISLPIIWLVVFDLVVLVISFKKQGFWRGVGKRWMWLLLPIWLSVSVLWSLNSLRGLLTVGIVWLIYLAVYGLVEFRNLWKEVGVREIFWKVFLGSTLMVCVWCWLQCVLDLLGVGQEYTLMCDGCTYHMFGFPHPNGFAIEPQFMGNLLLAPVIVIGWMWSKKQIGKKSERKCSRGDNFYNGSGGLGPKLQFGLLVRDRCKNHSGSHFLCSYFLPICFFIISSTLFLTFSRGAIYAFIVAMIVMTIWWVVRTKKWKALSVWVVIVSSFVFTLNIQGLMAEVSPTRDTYTTGVAKVLNHLSLGVIDINVAENEEITGAEVVENSVENFVDNQETLEGEEAAFAGYVAESTDTRLRLSGAAFSVWHQDFATALFGVGLGGAGQALYVNGLSPAPKEIVQNQYVSLLLETGLMGVALLVLTLVMIVRLFWKSSWRMVLICLPVAYWITLLFFSGLPNALHIYLLPAVIYVMGLRKKLVS